MTAKPPLGHVLPRRARLTIDDALADTRVVLINGARQSGKSTIVAEIGRQRGASWQSLDRATTRAAAQYDPTSFVQTDGM